MIVVKRYNELNITKKYSENTVTQALMALRTSSYANGDSSHVVGVPLLDCFRKYLVWFIFTELVFTDNSDCMLLVSVRD